MKPRAVDPEGCRCTECLTGEHVPLDWADPWEIEDLVAGRLDNHTGLSAEELARRFAPMDKP